MDWERERERGKENRSEGESILYEGQEDEKVTEAVCVWVWGLIRK